MQDWPVILEQYGGLVWRTARRLLHHDADAADCFQETFVSALQFAQRQRVENWPGLLSRLATTRALDLLRKRMANRVRQPDEMELDQLPASDGRPESVAESAELAELLRHALTQLPSIQAEIYCLRYLNDMSYEEIASELNLTTDAVGVALHRARARLRDLLGCVTGKESRGES